MFKSLEVELLKMRRTKSFLIAFLIMGFGIFWEVSAKYSQLIHSGKVESLWNNQTAETIVLPILVVIFSTKLIRHEQAGHTFKIQMANGQSFLSIFRKKLLVSILFFAILSLSETMILALVGMYAGIKISMMVFGIKVLSNILACSSLSLLYLPFALLTEKQGLVLGSGFLGAFFGLILMRLSNQLWGFIFPILGVSYLAPYAFLSFSDGIYHYAPTSHLFLRFCLYLAYLLFQYWVVLMFLKKERGK